MFALAITVSSVLAVTLTQTYQHSSSQLTAQFRSSSSVLNYKLNADLSALKKGLETISRDFSTKTLIRRAKQDPASLQLALTNFQKRLNVDFLVAYNNERVPLSTTPNDEPVLQPKYQNEDGFHFIYKDQTLYLLTVQAVKFVESAPTVDAWLMSGIKVQRLLGEDVRDITNFDISIRYMNIVRATTDTQNDLSELTAAFANIPHKFQNQANIVQHTTFINEQEHVVFQLYFGLADGQPIDVFFVVPSSKAHLNYENLIIQLSAAIAVILVLISFLTFSFSKSIAKPLRMLADVANQIRKGQYPEFEHNRSLEEVESLSFALSDMQQAIKSREQENYRLAYFSSSTELPNRTFFLAKINEYIAQEPDASFAVLWMDVDRFKDFNDTLGHEFGDAVLKAIATRLNEHKSSSSFLAYLDGDEYAAIIPLETESDAIVAANQVAHLFDEPFLVNDVALDVSISIGVSVYPNDTCLPEKLMQYADIALYDAKDKHHSISRFVAAKNKYSVVRLSLMTELKNAIEKQQLQLNFQPKIDLKTGKVISVESLVRWKHPKHGFIFPDEFIPLAEQTGNIRHLTHWAIETSLQQHLRLKELGFEIKMAINISAIDLTDLALPPFVANLLEKYQVSPEALIFEVTESAIMDDPEQAIKALNMLSNMKIKLSIDDFGTGYSSMEQLKRTPVDELKIDKSFVLDLANNSDDLIIVKSISSLAHNLGLTIVAEGIEDKATMEILAELNIETGQGYYMSKPLEATMLEAWLMGNSGLFLAKDL